VDVALLNARPKKQYYATTNWPEGTKQKLSKANAKRFFDLLSTSRSSLLELLRANPDLPPYHQLHKWRSSIPWFQEAWRTAREQQAEFLVQRCLDLAESTEPTNAHAQRVKFDIYWKVASKFFPSVYGDKPQTVQTTNVSIGVAISPERLNDIRAKLDDSRSSFRHPRTPVKDSQARLGNGSHSANECASDGLTIGTSNGNANQDQSQ
jgi:hypothetical protein